MQVVIIAIGLFAAMLLAAAIRADQRRAIVILQDWFVGCLAREWHGLPVLDFHCSVFDIVDGKLVLRMGDHDCQLDGATFFPDKLLFDATPRHALHDAIYLKSDDVASEWAFAGWTGERVRAWADDVAAAIGRELASRSRCRVRRALSRGLERLIYFSTGLFGETAHAWYARGMFAGLAALRGARFSVSPDPGVFAGIVVPVKLRYCVRELGG